LNSTEYFTQVAGPSPISAFVAQTPCSTTKEPDKTMNTESASNNNTQKKAFVLDAEQFRNIAQDQVIRTGLAWFKENRVMELDSDEVRLWALVEDEQNDEELSCELSYDDEGKLLAQCDCDPGHDGVCAHAVAALYAYSDQSEGEVLAGASDTAISVRVKRGRAEVDVEALGKNWFGAWKTRSINSENPYSRNYRVNIRTLHRHGNYCACPDFATNQLGTCKHIEAVLHQIGKRDDYNEIKAQPVPCSYVYLDWDAVSPPQIRVHRRSDLAGEIKVRIDLKFSADGLFNGRVPDDFFRFEQWVRDYPGIDIGEDVMAWVQHISTSASQRLRATEICSQIESSGGHLPGIRVRLYPYQVQGVAFLAATGRALLADDMGLGKTIQAIAAASWLMQHDGVARVLVICPASLKHQWAREIEKFTDYPVQIIQGGPAARGVQYRHGHGFYVVNYELVLRDLSLINKTLSPDLIVLDEAQRIKNWRTKIASAIKRIASRYAFVLSGTPLENRLEDLYSLMQVIDPTVLGPLWRYMVKFHITDERDKVLGYRNLSELRQRLAPVMLRRDRRLVSKQLPQRIEQRLDVALTPEQQELHDSAVSAAGRLAHIAKTRPLTPSEQNRMMANLQQARMACNAAGLVDKETEGSPKIDVLADLIEELCVQSGHKAVVFSQWERMTYMVEQRLERMGVGSVRLHGGVPTGKRGALMDRFKDDDAIQVFISTDAGGVGLNLQSASVLINLDTPWNPAVLDQRIARVHRLGQTRTVQIILIVSTDSYEQHVMGLVAGKRHLFDNVVDIDGQEDVVGVDKRLLEMLADDLAEFKPGRGGSEHEAAQSGVESTDVVSDDGSVTVDVDINGLNIEQALTRSIETLQAHFGNRIERILGAGGGLLVVLDQVDSQDDLAASELSAAMLNESEKEIRVALIDSRTRASLQRLGKASPLHGAETYFEVRAESQAKTSRLVEQAQEKLQAAEILLQREQGKVAAELIVAALLSSAAAKAGIDVAPAVQESAVWLYAEALPNGWLDQEEANLVVRSVALSQAPNVPPALMHGLLDDVRAFVEFIN